MLVAAQITDQERVRTPVGTGTTGIAALQLGRHFTGIELNPAFAALAAERLRHAAHPQPGGNEGGSQ